MEWGTKETGASPVFRKGNEKTMMKIQDVIELKTYTEGERLSFAARYLVQVNFTFDLTVSSKGFGGTSPFCVRRDQLERLCIDLRKMHTDLEGSSRIDDNDSDAFIELSIKPNGRLTVAGQVGGTHVDHFLRFKF
jgi:hypothetical protein